MSYDPKTRTIVIEDQPQFDKDLLAHMKHVEAEVDKMVAAKDSMHKRRPLGWLGWVALAFNVIALGVFASEFSRHGLPRGDEAFMVLAFGCAPTISILALVLPGSKDSWLSLYWRRKRLEELKRIESLGG